MQICYNCGKEVDDTVLICPDCGALVKRYGAPVRESEEPLSPVAEPVPEAQPDVRSLVFCDESGKLRLRGILKVLCIVCTVVDFYLAFSQLLVLWLSTSGDFFATLLSEYASVGMDSSILEMMRVTVDFVSQNRTFVNGKSNCGGAIYSEEGYLNIIDCSFIDCSAEGSEYVSGGAIYFTGYNLTLSNCNFTNCMASTHMGSENVSTSWCSYGGAIYSNESFISVSGCSFVNCKAIEYIEDYSDGGAIYCINSNLTVSNSNFVNCSADARLESDGGAIYSEEGYLNIIDCSFIACSADYSGALDDFGFSREGDEKTADLLDEILEKKGCLTIDDLYVHVFSVRV